jgi:hypothetical protein
MDRVFQSLVYFKALIRIKEPLPFRSCLYSVLMIDNGCTLASEGFLLIRPGTECSNGGLPYRSTSHTRKRSDWYTFQL